MADGAKTPQSAFRFEAFELDLRAGELRRNGEKAVRLPEQPFQILVMLLEHAGDVVTREELRKRLWPNDTIVEFEHSISAAMNRLRQALGDSADNPHFVETLARRGYRWIVPVQRVVPDSVVPSAPGSSVEPEAAGDGLLGKKISHYRVLGVVGGGGMGVVYRAEDLKLGRRVAMKFLPEEFAAEAVALERFEREARAASVLDHPNICTVYEFGEHSGRPFIVMQLLEGQTLRERIETGLPLGGVELLDVAVQIVEGLRAAHQSGIIHRDIKPANIFLTTRREAKILDFGVAKLVHVSEALDAPSSTPSADPTLPDTLLLTVTGKSMGTASYMSPEQVRGEKLDARTDLFSFGLVLYEMATAKPAFPGETATQIQAAILQKTQTSPKDLNSGVASGLDRVITKCLQKERESRYQTAADLLADLQQLQRASKPRPSMGGLRWMTGATVAAAVLATLIGGWRRLERREESALPSVKVVPLVTNSGIEGRPAFSPDGRQVAFMWNGGKGTQFDVYVKLIGDGSAPVRLTRAANGRAGWPVWSPDGHRIAYLRCSETSNAAYVIPTVGGSERKIVELGESCSYGLDWSPDGSLLAFHAKDSGEASSRIFLVSVEGGKRHPLTTPQVLEQDAEPKFSPDGKTLAFVRSHNPIVDEIFVVPVDGGMPKELTSLHGFVPGLAWTENGSEIVFSETSRDTGNNSLWRVKVHGGEPERVTQLIGVNATEPAIARHGNRLAFRTMTANTNIWQIRFLVPNGQPSAPLKLISSNRFQDVPQYSPDGTKIAFASDRSGGSQIWVCNSDASNPVQLTFMDAPNVGTPRWSPDGRTIVFDSTTTGNLGLYTISAEGGSPRPLVVDSHFNAAASFSRDGNWVYFVSDRTGDYQVWKIPARGGQLAQVTSHGGWMPMESIDGRLLYFLKTNLPIDPSGAPATLWSMPTQGGEERLVSQQKIHLHWAVAANGIYFTDPDTKPLPALKVLDVETGKVRTIATIQEDISCCGQSLTVSPDGRSILYANQDSVSTDIMLVENFR